MKVTYCTNSPLLRSDAIIAKKKKLDKFLPAKMSSKQKTVESRGSNAASDMALVR